MEANSVEVLSDLVYESQHPVSTSYWMKWHSQSLYPSYQNTPQRPVTFFSMCDWRSVLPKLRHSPDFDLDIFTVLATIKLLGRGPRHQ